MHRPVTLPGLHYLLPMQTLQGRGRHLWSLPTPRRHRGPGDRRRYHPGPSQWEPETIRLIGVDTPKTKDPRKSVERFGKEASQFTSSLLKGQPVRFEIQFIPTSRDRYGTLLATSFARVITCWSTRRSSGKAMGMPTSSIRSIRPGWRNSGQRNDQPGNRNGASGHQSILGDFMLTIACAKCGKVGRIPEAYMGHSVRCKACGSGFQTVPPHTLPPDGLLVASGSSAITAPTPHDPVVCEPIPG